MKKFVAAAVLATGLVFVPATAQAEEAPAPVETTVAPVPDPGPKPKGSTKYKKDEYIWCNVVDWTNDKYVTYYVLNKAGTKWVKKVDVYPGKFHQRKATKKDWKRGGITKICKPKKKKKKR